MVRFDLKGEKSLAVVNTKAGAASLKAAGIADPAAHFQGKTIGANGTVKEVDEVSRVEIGEANQFAVVE